MAIQELTVGKRQRLVEAAAGTGTWLSSLSEPEMPHFNPMRVLANRVVRQFEGREDRRPVHISAEPVIGAAVCSARKSRCGVSRASYRCRRPPAILDEMPLRQLRR